MAQDLCFWNDFELKKPPLVTIEVENTGFAKNVFVAINKFLQQMGGQDFDETAALIGRLMTRRKNSFRNMPGFRAICKLNSALCRLLRLDLCRDLEQFRGSLPDVYVEDTEGALPTKSSFEFILVRLLAFYYLHKRIAECCLSAASYFTKLLRSNFFMDFTTLLIAAIAKIKKLSADQATQSAQLYNKLRQHRNSFPEVKNHKFLPDNQELPENLEPMKSLKSEAKEEKPQSVLLKPKEVVTRVQKSKSDVGMVIARKETSKPSFNEAALATVEDAQRFIARETKARKQNPLPEDCFTGKISKHEWLAAQKLFHQKLSKDPAKALSLFRKFVVSKIK
ncbi:uncharacterized protein Dana_GF24671 [Drosophila ananassae]|uniref:Nucleolus and neural progenitor protein-like N-terminal domain-containing protein n=1 Tax=Drosophila ananassae TaxID=7217 RepID=B3MA77_DROAN|nr:uncharacterized protein LOC6507302 [Drosophila ananassae]EDV39091.1 uncharacterized protein Dana_GF24671 [Drosophila ananassae]